MLRYSRSWPFLYLSSLVLFLYLSSNYIPPCVKFPGGNSKSFMGETNGGWLRLCGNGWDVLF